MPEFGLTKGTECDGVNGRVGRESVLRGDEPASLLLSIP
jgi:hypothetical protein